MDKERINDVVNQVFVMLANDYKKDLSNKIRKITDVSGKVELVQAIELVHSINSSFSADLLSDVLSILLADKEDR